jgi:hypothetical protein
MPNLISISISLSKEDEVGGNVAHMEEMRIVYNVIFIEPE